MNKMKKILLPLACRFLLKPKSFAELSGQIRRIYCREEDLKLLADTSNNVYVGKADGKTFFFRECKKHLPLYDYVMGAIDIYYTHVVSDVYGDRCFLAGYLQDSSRLKLFANMGMTNDLNSGAYRFCMGKGPGCIGLPSMDPDREERLKELVQYIWGDLFSYSLNSGLKIGHYQTYNAVRCIATYRVAELIGLEHMIPKTDYALLCPEGRSPLFGTVMESAPGICMETLSCEERENISSPMLQLALNRLNVLDVLNMEKDHRPGNYHVVIRNGKGENVVAFDNDSPNSFGLGGISFSTYMGCSPWCSDGKLNRPYVDKILAQRILALEDNRTKKQLGDILNRMQLSSFMKRLHEIQKVLKTTPPEQFLTEEQWTAETMEKELSGNYGKTYLKQFLGEQKLIEQPWIKDRKC